MYQFPCSPKEEIDGLPYCLRLFDKIRLHHAGKLHPDYHENLGKGFDLWTCQFLGVSYEELSEQIIANSNDEEVLQWAREHGAKRSDLEKTWWLAYMYKRGYRDEMSERLQMRKQEAGIGDRADIVTFFDYIDTDEERM